MAIFLSRPRAVRAVVGRSVHVYRSRATWGSGGDVVPPDWVPWSLMSTGAVVMLYSFTLPKKLKS